MEGLLPYLVLIGAGLAVFSCAWLIAKRGVRWRLVGAGVILTGLLAKAAMSWLPVWEAAIFPFAWYIYLQSFVMPILMMAFFGLAIPQLSIPWNRVVVALIALGFYAYLGATNWWMVDPPMIGDVRIPDAQHHMEQSTMYTCAPSAAAIAVSYVGVEVSERTMAARCLTVAERGTAKFNTYRGLMLTLTHTPWRPRMAYVSADDLCRPGQVAVIDFPDIRHAITTVGRGDHATLHDPLWYKPEIISREDLAKRYGGVAILIEPR